MCVLQIKKHYYMPYIWSNEYDYIQPYLAYLDYKLYSLLILIKSLFKELQQLEFICLKQFIEQEYTYIN